MTNDAAKICWEQRELERCQKEQKQQPSCTASAYISATVLGAIDKNESYILWNYKSIGLPDNLVELMALPYPEEVDCLRVE